MMPSRRSASARTGPTPLRYVTGVSRNNRCGRARSITRRSLLAQQISRELRRVERQEITGALADAEKLHGNVDRLVHRHDDAAASGAVELRHDESRHRDRFGEDLGLLHRVLTD